MTQLISPFRIVLIFIAIAAICWNLIPQLSVDLAPEESETTLTVQFSLPNSSPDIVEQQVSSVIEGACSQLSQLKKITSTSDYNRGTIKLEFDPSSDLQFKQFEVASIIRQIYPSLPLSTSYPTISVFSDNASQRPFLVYSINAPLTLSEIKKNTEKKIRTAFSGLKGLNESRLSGAENVQLAISFKAEVCRSLGVNTDIITRAIQTYFAAIHPGSFSALPGDEYFISLSLPASSINTIGNIIIPIPNGGSVKVSDLAKISFEEQPAESYFRINGKNSISLALYAQNGSNTIALAEQARAIIKRLQTELPKKYEIRLERDETEFMVKELDKNYTRIAVSLIILGIFILLAYRRSSPLIILFASLLASVCLSIVMIWMFHVNVNIYALAGLTISFGVMTDNAIVMLDYYSQFKNRRIWLALLASTFTTICALSLVFILPEKERKNLEDFATVVIICLSASLIVSLAFIPSLHELVTRKRSADTSPSGGSLMRRLRRVSKKVARYSGYIRFLFKHRAITVVSLTLMFGFPLFMLPARIEVSDVYNKTIGSDLYQDHAKFYLDRIFGGTLRMFVRNVQERSGFRDTEKTKLFINAQLPFGTRPAQMSEILSVFEGYLSKTEGIDKFTTNVYSGQRGAIEITFKNGFDNSPLPYMLKTSLISRSVNWDGVDWSIYGVGQAFTNGSAAENPSYHILAKGYNYEELERQAHKIEKELLKHPRIQKVNIDDQLNYRGRSSSEYVLSLDPGRLALNNINRKEVVQQLKDAANRSAMVSEVTIKNKTFPIVLKEQQADQFSSYRLLNNVFHSKTKAFKVSSVGNLKIQNIASRINKEDRQYIRVLSFEYMGSEAYGKKYLDGVLAAARKKMPIGYSAVQDIKEWDWETLSTHYWLILLLFALVFLICSILFENLQQGMYVVVLIPISFIGLFTVFSVGNFYFDQGGYAGFIILGGLVANASIFIINDFNNLVKQNPKRKSNQLLIKAITNRSRTVLLTTISTCCSLVPFILGGQAEPFWFSFSIGIIGGLFFSLFAVFIVLPTFLWQRS